MLTLLSMIFRFAIDYVCSAILFHADVVKSPLYLFLLVLRHVDFACRTEVEVLLRSCRCKAKSATV